jgi:hypothetical protein
MNSELTTKVILMKTPVYLFFAVLFFSCPAQMLAGTVNYQYDALGRIETVAYNNGSGTSYGYDSVGNRLQITNDSVPVAIYEDAENGDIAGWVVYDNDPSGATIANIEDTDRNSRVIEFSGSGLSNGFRLRNPDGSWWNNNAHGVIEWSMNYSENFVVYIAVQTTNGFRYLQYNSSDNDNLGTGRYIQHGLGSASRDGNWHTITRDLEFDIQEAQPGNNLEAILGFLIRGSGRVDHIETFDTFPLYVDSDNDGLTDLEERNTYGTHPYLKDTDGDGIDDGAEVAYWGGINWSLDSDGDSMINILDADSDNDGLSDGYEREYGTDPNDPTSGTSITYENAADGNTEGWVIYDDDPAGATVSNVYDEDSNSRVIEISGAGRANGYRFRKADGGWWNNTAHKVLDWRMKYSEDFTVYIAVQSTDGFRYLKYTPSDHDDLGTDRIIHHGLRSHAPPEFSITDGRWHTFTRDLEYDLKEAQPENNLEAILGFYIRGSGRIDYIVTINELPSVIDTDMDGIADLEERNTYGTHPYRSDTDEDGLNDGDEMIYWDIAWNEDVDGDGVINLLDADADNDGFMDGQEIEQGTDPGDADSVIDTIVYEDAEDGNPSNWEIYDNDPVGAMVSKIFDPEKGSMVVEFIGSGIGNSYRLRNSDGSWWYNGGHKTMEWSMKYSENFVVYIAVQTTDGFRYLHYTAANYDNLGTGRYVHHGLGSASKDGSWHTITRDLEVDLQEAQPDNHLEAILGFLIRGSGQIDDIKSFE